MSHWPTSLSNLSPRLARASDSALHPLVDVRDRAGRGLDTLRDLSHEAAASGVRAGRSTRALIADRPVESVLLVAGAAFAIGWLTAYLRRARTPRPAMPGTAKPAAARAKPAARTRKS